MVWLLFFHLKSPHLVISLIIFPVSSFSSFSSMFSLMFSYSSWYRRRSRSGHVVSTCSAVSFSPQSGQFGLAAGSRCASEFAKLFWSDIANVTLLTAALLSSFSVPCCCMILPVTAVVNAVYFWSSSSLCEVFLESSFALATIRMWLRI